MRLSKAWRSKHIGRVLLTGIHLMRTGKVEANLLVLNDEFRLPYVPEWSSARFMAQKKGFSYRAKENFTNESMSA